MAQNICLASREHRFDSVILHKSKIMASEKKMRKVSKRHHWGRGGAWLKEKLAGIKGLSFFTPALRRREKKVILD